MPTTILCGDCGGTNSRMTLYEVLEGVVGLRKGAIAPGSLVAKRNYKNADFGSFAALVEEFLRAEGAGATPTVACFAVAGPVKDNAVAFTNRNWAIDGAALQAELGIQQVTLINDFVANGYGLLTLAPDEVEVLQEAPVQPDAPMACIGAGTGLGECFLTPDGADSYHCWPSEGGHAEFAPRTPLEAELLEHLKAKFSERHRVSVERVVSGVGLWNVYEFLAQRFPERVVAAHDAEIRAMGDDKGAVIGKYSAVPGSLCEQAMQVLVTAYGSEAGVAGLKWLPQGGLYLAGGITPKNLHFLRGEDGCFLRAFHDKGRVAPMLRTVPVYAVLADDLGGRGAKYVAVRALLSLRGSSGATEAGAEAEAVPEAVPRCGPSTALVAGAAALAGAAVATLWAARRR